MTQSTADPDGTPGRTGSPGGPVGLAAALVPPGAHVLGDPAAPVTIVEFGDLECPYCHDAAPVLRAVVEESGGTVRLVFRHFPLFEVHPYALTAALAAEAAGAQGRFWEMHDLLFAHQDRLDDVGLAHWAQTLGLDGASVVGEAAQEHGDAVERDYLAGTALGVRGTPTLFVDGERYRGRVTEDGVRAAVAAALAGEHRGPRPSPGQGA
ncbi:thioredoxin domain-containing protein [Oerskovia sp. Sa1BUA8]|uniref:Thioredoxin domain-containing protein n=1 Tax=Oerskovia douganii TaxID=2762210 RepID=A0A9D5Z055_9CELL|nr:thioredoxin domain-containing protein [Oerskovia douganii]MBE7700824.1 thioredoxin domain-containing protein [Oerskovia douganii]